MGEKVTAKKNCISSLIFQFLFFFIHTEKTDFLKLRFPCKVDFFPARIFLFPQIENI